MYSNTVLETQHYTDRLFRIRTERPQGFRFRSGEFVMIGLPTENGKNLLRAYSIASPSWDETLEFYSIKVADGPLTARLQHIKAGDALVMAKKSTGTLVTDGLSPGKRLWMISTGTGVAPFASLIRDPEVYEKFDTLILTHTCRTLSELSYSQQVVAETRADEFLGDMATRALTFFPSTTKEEGDLPQGRITDLINNGSLFNQLDLPAWNPQEDRIMICGSMAMCQDVVAIAEAVGLKEGSNRQPAEYVLEKAFVS